MLSCFNNFNNRKLRPIVNALMKKYYGKTIDYHSITIVYHGSNKIYYDIYIATMVKSIYHS